MGGNEGDSNFLDSCEAYDIEKDEWCYVKSMRIKKINFSATVVNNQFIYTFGGYDGDNALASIERYDIA